VPNLIPRSARYSLLYPDTPAQPSPQKLHLAKYIRLIAALESGITRERKKAQPATASLVISGLCGLEQGAEKEQSERG
jgi:hypothetical protein